MTILKVQYNDEIRRVSIDDTCTVAELQSKIRYMFPQLRSFTMTYLSEGSWITISSSEDLLNGIAEASKSVPPVFRVSVVEPSNTKTNSTPISLPSHLEIPTPLPVTITPTSNSSSTSSSSEESVSPSKVLPDSKCSSCSSEFTLDDPIRFKCLSCYNYTVCEICELNNHDPKHLFVKMNRPVSQLPLKQQLIFTQQIEGSESDKALAKSENKAIRKLISLEKEASFKRREERVKARKEREKSRRSSCKKGSKVTSAAAIEVLPLVQFENAVVAVAPVVEEPVVIITPTLLSPLEDPIPQLAVEDIIAEPQETLVNAEEPKEEIKETDSLEGVIIVDVDEQEDVIEQTEAAEDVSENWSLRHLWNGLRGSIATEEPTVNVNDYRIAGIAFNSKMDQLEQMGFTDRNRNMIVLMKNFANLERAVEELAM